MIDTHCHLTSSQLYKDVDNVIAHAIEKGVSHMITVATDPEDAIKAMELANRNDQVSFSSGIHPLYAEKNWDWELILKAANDSNCVAWGELGLDRHYKQPPFELQVELLETQLGLIEQQAGDVRPIIVHCRRAVEDLLPIFAQSTISSSRFVFHCFTETPADAQKILDFGAMISFTGVVTYANAPDVQAAATLVPMDRLMVETDAPYLSPEPVRSTRPNEPQFVMHTAAFLANLKSQPWVEFEAQVDSNARAFFNISEV